MKLIVFGATGGIGKQVVQQALAAGHQVTAVVRRPAALTIQHKCLEVMRGDVTDFSTLEKPMIGQEAVISSIGVAHRDPTTLYSEGIANIMQAMKGAGVRRMFCVSASGLEPGPLVQRIFAKPLLWWVFKESYTDLVRMEENVKRTSLDWTILRPPRLTDAPLTGQHRAAINTHLPGSWFISRANLADYILKHLCDPAIYRAIVEVAH